LGVERLWRNFMTLPEACDWIAVDWGTSRLRVWAMDAQGAAMAHATSDQGMGVLAQGAFESALMALIAPWLGDARVPVIVCGMAGAREGWRQAAYRAVPCAPVAAGGLTPVPTDDPRLDVRIVPGLSQQTHADVMRGEETQIAGFLRADPGFEGVACLPGTHSKWVDVQSGKIVRFQTFMTGELFDLLADKSILRHMIAREQGADDAAGDAAFDAAARWALVDGPAVAAQLFGLRAAGLLHGPDPVAARARLSGLLIGSELCAARAYWMGRKVHLIGDGPVADRYARALTASGCSLARLDAEALTLGGLALVREMIKDAA
jgi:2-dehydro-3-deoxygalactonokinase